MTDREGIQPLLPCPFCGGRAMFEPFETPEHHFETVECEDCCNQTGCHLTREMAVAAWNRRAGGSTQEGLRIAAEIARESLMAIEAIEAAAAKGRK